MSVSSPTAVSGERAAVLARLAECRRVRGDEFHLDALGLFGSFARDEAGPQSDVDVVFQTVRPNLLVTVHLKQALEQTLGRDDEVFVKLFVLGYENGDWAYSNRSIHR
jgi:predicted nucleotidyltransferase